MFLTDAYGQCLQAIADQVFGIVKRQNNLIFEKSFFEGEASEITMCYSGKVDYISYPLYSPIHCRDLGIDDETSPIESRIFRIMKIRPPENFCVVIRSAFKNLSKEATASQIMDVCSLLYSVMLYYLHVGIIHTDSKTENFNFDEVKFDGKVFERYKNKDAMSIFLRTLIWRAILMQLPDKVNVWQIRKNLISLCGAIDVSPCQKILLVVMEDAKGRYRKYVPVEFVETFFELSDDISFLNIKDSTFVTRLSEKMEINSVNSRIQNKIDTLHKEKKDDVLWEKKVCDLYKKKNKIIKDTDYMLRLSKIFKDVMAEVKKYNVYSKGKKIPSKEVHRYLVQLLFHIPEKKTNLSKKKVNSTLYHLFTSLFRSIEDRYEPMGDADLST